MSQHPKAVEAAEKSAQARQMRETMKEYVKTLTGQGVRFLEIHPHHKGKHGHMTVAYIQQRRNIYAVSTALCHPEDDFDKLRGRAIAGNSLAGGQLILLRKPSACHLSVADWLDMKFREYQE